jgi:hypothetical protein
MEQITRNPFGHTFSYREYEGWDLDIAKQLCGITDRISYLHCSCECGWSADWKTQPWNAKTGRKIVDLRDDNVVRMIRDAHDHEIGQDTTWGEPKPMAESEI